LGVNPQTGTYEFEDTEEDGSISYPNDLQFLKERKQKHFGGLQNSFKYKRLQLDFLFQFVKQTGSSYMGGFFAPGRRQNQPTIVMKRWQNTGDVTSIQRFTSASFGSVSTIYNDEVTYGDNQIVDASFIRLKNISLSYEFSSNLIQKAKFQNMRIYIQAQNMLTITNYLGLDPETQLNSRLPPLKMITAGIQFTL
jgi:hypothetical protein